MEYELSGTRDMKETTSPSILRHFGLLFWHVICGRAGIFGIGVEEHVAQQHPTINGKLEGMSNVSYDLVAALSGTGDVIDTIDTYIEDANQANDREVVQAFDQI